MMQKYGTLVIVLIVAVSAWLAGLPAVYRNPSVRAGTAAYRTAAEH